jgi:ABC-type antimicrobial peptide transport system permease subunit
MTRGTPALYIGAAVVVAVMAGAVSLATLKTSRLDPIEALRYE